MTTTVKSHLDISETENDKMAFSISKDPAGILNTFRRMLSCMECGQWVKKKVYTCPRACGVMCTSCAIPLIMNCPKCSQGGIYEVPFLGELSKEIHMLTMSACPNAQKGCVVWVEGPELDDHLSECLAEPLRCPGLWCERSPERGQFAKHLLVYHTAGGEDPTILPSMCATPLYPKPKVAGDSRSVIKYSTPVVSSKPPKWKLRTKSGNDRVLFPPFILLRGTTPPTDPVERKVHHPIPVEVFFITVEQNESGHWTIAAWSPEKRWLKGTEVTLRVSGKGNNQYFYKGKINLHVAQKSVVHPIPLEVEENGLFLPPDVSKALETTDESATTHFDLQVEIHSEKKVSFEEGKAKVNAS